MKKHQKKLPKIVSDQERGEKLHETYKKRLKEDIPRDDQLSKSFYADFYSYYLFSY